MQAASNKEKESQAAKEWNLADGGSAEAAGTTVGVAAEDLHMSAVPKRVVQLADIIAVCRLPPCASMCSMIVACSCYQVPRLSGACVAETGHFGVSSLVCKDCVLPDATFNN